MNRRIRQQKQQPLQAPLPPPQKWNRPKIDQFNPWPKSNRRPKGKWAEKMQDALQQRKHVVWITRLPTGHCHLNEYLHRFNNIETPECEWRGKGNGRSLSTKLWIVWWRERRVEKEMRSSVLLGDNQIIKKTVEYIEKTGRFKLDWRYIIQGRKNHCREECNTLISSS